MPASLIPESAPPRRSALAMLLAAPLALLLKPAHVWAMSTPATARLDPQPHMRAALTALESAKNHLEAANPDKGGHRVKALELVQNAMRETEAGIRFDNRR